MKKIDICCFVYGKDFLDTLENFALPSFVNSINKANKNFNYKFIFYTKKNFKNRLTSIAKQLLHRNKFKVNCIEDINIPGRIWEIDVWNYALKISDSDYFLILIPDNYYFSSYVSNVLKHIKNNDLVIGLPPYICKNTIDNQNINIHSLGLKEIFFLLSDHAHPFYFGLVGSAKRNVKGFYQSREQELTIDMFNEEFSININCAHPIALNSSNFSFDHLNFRTRLKKNIFSMGYLDSIMHVSIDRYDNKLRLFNNNSVNYFLRNLKIFCQNYLYHPWEAYRFFSNKYLISKKINRRVISNELDLFYIMRDNNFLQYIEKNNIQIGSIYDLYSCFANYSESLICLPQYKTEVPKKFLTMANLTSLATRRLKSKFETFKFYLNPMNEIVKDRLGSIEFGKKSKELFK